MAVINLQSLVLCRVAVRCGGQAANLRLGTGYTGIDQTLPMNRSMQHPLTDPLAPAAKAGERKWQAFARPAERIEVPVADRVVDAVVGGAGRSPGHAGVSALAFRLSSESHDRTSWSSSCQTQASSILAGRKTKATARKS
jgi:hypothetical protein